MKSLARPPPKNNTGEQPQIPEIKAITQVEIVFGAVSLGRATLPDEEIDLDELFRTGKVKLDLLEGHHAHIVGSRPKVEVDV